MLAAGLLGISGGMIISPLLLQLGVHPQVAAATSTFVVLLSTAVAALTFGLAGMLRAQPAAIFSVCCFCASLIGVLCIASLIRRTNKVSLPPSKFACQQGLLSSREAIKVAYLDMV